jgi:hypothetical protein
MGGYDTWKWFAAWQTSIKCKGKMIVVTAQKQVSYVICFDKNTLYKIQTGTFEFFSTLVPDS